MIKKLISVVLVLCLAVLNVETVFASDDFADDFENEVLMEQLAKIKRRGIFYLSGDIGIHKEEVKLESFLNKKYRLFKYVVKNKSDKTLFLKLYPFDEEKIYKNARDEYRKERFPYAYGHAVRAAGETIGSGAILASAKLFPPLAFAYAMADDSDTGVFDFDNIPIGWEIPKTYLLNPIKSTLLLPYDLYRNPNEIKKAKAELEKISFLIDDGEYILIKPGEKVEFYHIATIDKEDEWGANDFQLYSKSKNGDYQTEANFKY